MCGLAGIIDVKARRDIDSDALRRMMRALRHRGPDDENDFLAPGVGLAHTRLAVIDRAGGVQPFHAQDGGGALVYNGEIYNYAELSRGLEAEGCKILTRSDTETLAEGLAMHGPAFVERLRGMFAFAYWDERTQSLLLGRDRLGEKPLHYTLTEDGFLLFASEIGALLASGLVDARMDDTALADYFFYGFIPDPKSIYRNVHKLPPATLLRMRRGEQAQTNIYWSPSFAERPVSFDEAREELLPLLDDAVKSQMIADAPLGAFLSGGVDSSAIVAAMSQAGGRVKSCAIGFDDEAFDERPFARAVAAAYGADHVDEQTTIDGAALIDEIAAIYGEPFADASALPTYLVSALARRRVTVALSGDGGDELFHGYRRHARFQRMAAARKALPQALRKALFTPAGAVYPKLDWAPQPLRLKTAMQSLSGDDATDYARAIAANLPGRMHALMSPDLRHALDDYDPADVVGNAMGGDDQPPMKRAMRADLRVWLPGRMLVKVDRAAMAHSLETRAPFLDHRLVEWAASLPSEHALNKGAGKYVLKRALEPRLPKEILYRRKQGFAPPVARWFRGRGGLCDQLLAARGWRQSGLFNERVVERMTAAHAAGRSDCSQELWTVLMFDAFERTRKAAASST